MVLLDTGEIDSGQIDDTGKAAATPRGRRRVRAGVGLLVVGAGAQVAWLTWRVAHLPLNPVALVVLAVELTGVAATVAIGAGLACAHRPRAPLVTDPRDSHRFAFAIADAVGRTRSTDVRRALVAAVRAAPGRRPWRSADAAMAAVYLEGPRRLLLIAALCAALLLGAAPMGMPPAWAIATMVAGALLGSVSHVVLGHGRIRFGDRIRWSYSSIGETVGATDPDGIAPRRWVGTMASLVVVNLSVALRGTSDRWTHGLAPMPTEQRVTTMLLALLVVAGALFTMRTIQPPVVDSARWSRRLEERTARQSALGATVVVGLIGLLAGVLPDSVDPPGDAPPALVQVVDDGAGTVGG